MPIRPVVNNKFAPAHTLAKFLNTKIKTWQILRNTYNASNSLTTAEDLIRLNIMPNKEIITLGINELYTNLPTKGNYRGDKTLVRAKHDQQSRTGTISILTENHHTAKLFSI